MSGETRTLLDIRNLSMRYPSGKLALAGVDLSVAAGEIVIVLGSNGSGKSTMLRCVSRLLDPSGGSVTVAGRDLARLRGEELRRARMAVAMVFQHANLVRRRSVVANVCTGVLGHHRTLLTTAGLLPKEELGRAHTYLEAVGLSHLAAQRAGTLSGGQAQRVAISRALAQRPQVVLADEPVASLDPQAAEEVMGLLRRLARNEGMAVLCVLHQPELAARYGDRVVGMQGGSLVFDMPAAAISAESVAHLYDRIAA